MVLKLKTAQFRILTRSHTPDAPPASLRQFADIAVSLRDRVDLPAETRYRLVGVGLGGFREPGTSSAQSGLFDPDSADDQS